MKIFFPNKFSFFIAFSLIKSIIFSKSIVFQLKRPRVHLSLRCRASSQACKVRMILADSSSSGDDDET